MRRCLPWFLLLLFVSVARADEKKLPLAEHIRQHYQRSDHKIRMRDGVHLYTIVYTPRDRKMKYPILMTRTPYSVRPYEEGEYRRNLGPSEHFAREGYIVVYQDVRGRYLSEGVFENMRPHRTSHQKDTDTDIDESTDTYDTIDYLVKNIPGHNGKVGLWGISYPGFYASAGMINAHPALKAVSPQAPIADWFFDDFFHHGAFFLNHAFRFFSSFGQPRPQPTTVGAPSFEYPTPDGYRFFLDLGALRHINPRHFKNRVAFWQEFVKHPNYDEFWQARNILPHLKKVAPAVMTVGGWFDAEDLYGPLRTYAAIEKQNPGIFNVLVMGPWRHGGWASDDGSRLGNIQFGSKTAEFYRENIEFPFFNHFLKGTKKLDMPEAYVFETGANAWRGFGVWPPRQLERKKLFLQPRRGLAFSPPTEPGKDEFLSDPQHPVPFTESIVKQMTVEYMTDDQRFASRRPDVLTYRTLPLSEDVTLAGPLTADLWVSTTAGDADWVVKVIDVFPDSEPNLGSGRPLGGYEMMVRSEVMRGRFRQGYAKPVPFTPGKVERVRLPLQDVLHTFKKGHRITVQIHSTWFPLVDRNPQKWVPNIFLAQDSDFTRATHTVQRGNEWLTCLEVGVLPRPKK